VGAISQSSHSTLQHYGMNEHVVLRKLASSKRVRWNPQKQAIIVLAMVVGVSRITTVKGSGFLTHVNVDVEHNYSITKTAGFVLRPMPLFETS
jgi:hypothetical protein